MATRTERDSLGALEVPDDRLWGAQTQRSLDNFPIGTQPMPSRLVHAYGLIKQAAAASNAALGVLPPERADWIGRAALEVARGELDAHFPLRVWQSGSGTQTHMNCNEVIARRANEIAGLDADSPEAVHPNDDVNRSQSTNDTFPTAMHLSAALALRDALDPALDALLGTLDEKSRASWDIAKIGRTHLQDATPLRLGQEIGGWASQIRVARRAIDATRPLLCELAVGATAVGTGLNAPPGFGEEVCARLADATGLPFVSARDKFAALAGHEPMAALSGALSTLAGALIKLANDVRWLASGPRCGIGELRIPENEPGSSIMPGKTNPTQAEALLMVCFQVLGHHTTVSLAASQGNFELNVCKPLIAHDVLESIELLADAVSSFDRRCCRGIEPDREGIEARVEQSLMLVTALSPHIGYEAAARIALRAHRGGTTLREAALAGGEISAEDYDRWVRVEAMLGPERDPDA